MADQAAQSREAGCIEGGTRFSKMEADVFTKTPAGFAV
jgi:hypothetical protein